MQGSRLQTLAVGGPRSPSKPSFGSVVGLSEIHEGLLNLRQEAFERLLSPEGRRAGTPRALQESLKVAERESQDRDGLLQFSLLLLSSFTFHLSA
jgi:hypothetical protein